MAYDPEVIRDAAITVLSDANTTTATNYLSLNVAAGKVSEVTGGKPWLSPELIVTHPKIWVWVARDSEEIAELGASARRDIDLDLQVVAVTRSNNVAGPLVAENDMYRLTRNIRTILRNAPRLGRTDVLWHTTETEYDWEMPGPPKTESVYVRASSVTMKARLLSL